MERTGWLSRFTVFRDGLWKLGKWLHQVLQPKRGAGARARVSPQRKALGTGVSPQRKALGTGAHRHRMTLQSQEHPGRRHQSQPPTDLRRPVPPSATATASVGCTDRGGRRLSHCFHALLPAPTFGPPLRAPGPVLPPNTSRSHRQSPGMDKRWPSVTLPTTASEPHAGFPLGPHCLTGRGC